jgi:type IV pilus assembly protein PilV
MDKSKRNSRGFTLVEVMVAMVIVLVAMMGLLQSVNIVTDTNIRNQARDEAVQVGQGALNDMMAQSLTNPAFNLYSTKVPSRIRGISKQYRVTGRRDLIASMNSVQLSVRVSSIYRNVTSVYISSIKALP